MVRRAGLSVAWTVTLSILFPYLHGQDLEVARERSPWIHASEYRYKAALREFRTLQNESTGPEKRRARFGEALMLLNVQPRTVDKIESAREIFLDIAYEDPTDELSIRSIFYLGRINQVHQSAWDWHRASLYYEELIRRWPQHPFTQMGLSKYAMVQLYQPNSREEREEAPEKAREAGGNPDLSAGGARLQLCRWGGLSEHGALQGSRICNT